MASQPLTGLFFTRLAPGRFSTGTKMLLILTVALLPLGLIALFASIQSAQNKRLQRAADARVVATAEARQIDILLLRGVGMIRGNLSAGTPGPAACHELLQRDLAALGSDTRIALFSVNGQPICTTAQFGGQITRPAGTGVVATLLPNGAGLGFIVPIANGGYGAVEIPTHQLQEALIADPTQGIALRQGSDRLVLATAHRTTPFTRKIHAAAPAAGGQLSLELVVATNPISAVEILLVLLPVLMWGAAAIICWLVLDQAIIHPLRLMQRAIADYHPGSELVLPRLATPAEEIRALGEALESTTGLVIARELELEAGLERQVRLTREVHHRVKNNLQVVASLINLHARGTKGEVADAYASIQRRVDALAVVHRNHYAELEENRGVALRSIIAELTANLRGTAPPQAAHLSIAIDIAPAFITQDVAVPISFLVTEIVELAMSCDPRGQIVITLRPGDTPDRSLFTVQSPGLSSAACEGHPTRARFERITGGLARQLRSALDYDAATGKFSIAIPILLEREEEKKVQAPGT